MIASARWRVAAMRPALLASVPSAQVRASSGDLPWRTCLSISRVPPDLLAVTVERRSVDHRLIVSAEPSQQRGISGRVERVRRALAVSPAEPA
jgi:hypothetical protein